MIVSLDQSFTTYLKYKILASKEKQLKTRAGPQNLSAALNL